MTEAQYRAAITAAIRDTIEDELGGEVVPAFPRAVAAAVLAVDADAMRGLRAELTATQRRIRELETELATTQQERSRYDPD